MTATSIFLQASVFWSISNYRFKFQPVSKLAIIVATTK